MKCNNCGFDSNNNDDLFCNYCGTRLNVEFKKAPDYTQMPDNNIKGNNFVGNNQYPPPPAYSHVRVPGNAKSSSKNGVMVVIVAFAVIMCILIVSGTAFILTRNNDTNTAGEDGENSSYVQQGATQKETQAYVADDTSYYNGESPDSSAKIPSGTRCKVDSYIDGSKSLVLRPSPDKSGEHIAYAGRDNYVTVIKNYYSGDYIKIALISEGYTYEGWVLVEYLHVVPDYEGIVHTELSAGTKCRVTYSDGLNLWVKPRADEEKRKAEGSNGKVPYGETIELVYQYNINDNGYVYAKYNGRKGWVDAEYIEIDTEKNNMVTTESDKNASMSADEAHELFKNAQILFEEYSILEENKYDESDYIIEYNSVAGADVVYYKTKLSVDSIDGLYDILHNYLSDDFCRNIIESSYTEKKRQTLSLSFNLGF